MSITSEDKLGSVKISDEVIAICAVNATLKTKGVAELSGGLTNILSRNILGKELLSKGIKVSQGEEGTIIIDVFVIVEYGVKIPVVAWDIQENVKKEIEDMINVTVEAVNIHVQGVYISGQEESSND